MVIGSFGKLLVFEVHPGKVLTPRNVKRDMAAAYEEHKVLGAKPRLEFLAPELNTFSLSVLLSASMGVDPADTMLTVQALIVGGIVEQLILGGMNYGRHVLVKATEEWTKGGPKGNPISIQVSLEFKQYVI